MYTRRLMLVRPSQDESLEPDPPHRPCVATQPLPPSLLSPPLPSPPLPSPPIPSPPHHLPPQHEFITQGTPAVAAVASVSRHCRLPGEHELAALFTQHRNQNGARLDSPEDGYWDCGTWIQCYGEDQVPGKGGSTAGSPEAPSPVEKSRPALVPPPARNPGTRCRSPVPTTSRKAFQEVVATQNHEPQVDGDDGVLKFAPATALEEDRDDPTPTMDLPATALQVPVIASPEDVQRETQPARRESKATPPAESDLPQVENLALESNNPPSDHETDSLPLRRSGRLHTHSARSRKVVYKDESSSEDEEDDPGSASTRDSRLFSEPPLSPAVDSSSPPPGTTIGKRVRGRRRRVANYDLVGVTTRFSPAKIPEEPRPQPLTLKTQAIRATAERTTPFPRLVFSRTKTPMPDCGRGKQGQNRIVKQPAGRPRTSATYRLKSPIRAPMPRRTLKIDNRLLKATRRASALQSPTVSIARNRTQAGRSRPRVVRSRDVQTHVTGSDTTTEGDRGGSYGSPTSRTPGPSRRLSTGARLAARTATPFPKLTFADRCMETMETPVLSPSRKQATTSPETEILSSPVLNMQDLELASPVLIAPRSSQPPPCGQDRLTRFPVYSGSPLCSSSPPQPRLRSSPSPPPHLLQWALSPPPMDPDSLLEFWTDSPQQLAQPETPSHSQVFGYPASPDVFIDGNSENMCPPPAPHTQRQALGDITATQKPRAMSGTEMTGVLLKMGNEWDWDTEAAKKGGPSRVRRAKATTDELPKKQPSKEPTPPPHLRVAVSTSTAFSQRPQTSQPVSRPYPTGPNTKLLGSTSTREGARPNTVTPRRRGEPVAPTSTSTTGTDFVSAARLSTTQPNTPHPTHSQFRPPTRLNPTPPSPPSAASQLSARFREEFPAFASAVPEAAPPPPPRLGMASNRGRRGGLSQKRSKSFA